MREKPPKLPIPKGPNIKFKENFLNKKETAVYLSVSIPTLNKGIKEGFYPKPVQTSAKRKSFHKKDLDKFLSKIHKR